MTVLAPSDEAFMRLLAQNNINDVTVLLNPAVLAQVLKLLQYHVIPGGHCDRARACMRP